MKPKAFEKLLSKIDNLTPNQVKKLQKELNQHNNLKAVDDITQEINHCPHCGATKIYKWGIRSQMQRYKCRECNKTFNALSKTPLARLRAKEKWNEYAQTLLKSDTVAQSAKKCNIATTTSFRWRHRMLEAAKSTKANKLHGIVELDETYFPKSNKGDHHLEREAHKRGGWASQGLSLDQQVPVLIARDRNGNMSDAVMENSQDGTIAQVMLPLLDRRDVLLCSDSKSSYKSFAKWFDFEHETINTTKEHTRGIYHVQNVNAYDSRLKNWMVHFHGVSTKHLHHYLDWMRLLDTHKNLSTNSFLKMVANYRAKDYRFPPLTLI